MNVPAGRELDALVAEKVMGWKPIGWPLPNFSATWEGAGVVVGRMVELGWVPSMFQGLNKAWGALFQRYGSFGSSGDASAQELPHAVCLAALDAVQGEKK